MYEVGSVWIGCWLRQLMESDPTDANADMVHTALEQSVGALHQVACVGCLCIMYSLFVFAADPPLPLTCDALRHATTGITRPQPFAS